MTFCKTCGTLILKGECERCKRENDPHYRVFGVKERTPEPPKKKGNAVCSECGKRIRGKYELCYSCYMDKEAERLRNSDMKM